jgi:ribosomal protein S18 acetylase RimI-like enzyme
MLIRVARAEDAPAMARVIVDTGRSAHRDQVPEELLLRTPPPLEEAYAESERNWRRFLGEIAGGACPRDCAYVAEDEAGEVIGLAVGGPARGDAPENTGEIRVLYVRDSHQRRGFGRHLVQAVAAHLAQRGMPALRIGCLAANTPARRFYEALGGRVVGTREFDQDGVMLPEVVYGWTDTVAFRTW